VKRLEDLAHVPPKALYTTREGLADNYISRLFEDSNGDIWISSFHPPVMLTRWERATESFHRYSDQDGLPSSNWANAFAEDRAGNLWLGLHNGGLARRRNGRFEVFDAAEGVPMGLGQGLFLDTKGSLVGSRGKGVGRIEDPAAEHPRASAFTSVEKLSSDNLRCFTEDSAGKIYIGTARGVDRLDPATGQLNHFTVADGLIRSGVMAAYRDRNDNLWFGTLDGLSRFVPGSNRVSSPPPVLIDGIRIAGVSRPVSELGEVEINNLQLAPGQNQIEVDFFAINFSAGENLRYQYKIEGMSNDWSAPTDQRTIAASLTPGHYRFLVRAVRDDGATSEKPASISFTVLSPFWQRWWFITLVALVAGLSVYTIYRYRVGRLLELERVRTRIATDLHDDIGSSLSQISVLSEVVQRQLDRDRAVSEPLSVIANLSRDLVDSMSDIVWAINPKRDRLSDLTQRMRRFSSDVFTARNVAFDFTAPESRQDTRMGADMRREVFLIFKEAVNNIVRHSNCSKAKIEFRLEAGSLDLLLIDNGRGFDAKGVKDGNGLASMNQRAAKLGGDLQVISSPESGTTVKLKVPFATRVWSKSSMNMI
jgi:two-component sensor histidine kinase